MRTMTVNLFLAAVLTTSSAALAETTEPKIVAPGLVSTEVGEYSPTFDVNRQELIFMRRTPGRFDYTLHTSTLTISGWTTPEVLPFSGQHRDGGPSFSPDGDTLVFDSRRPNPVSGDGRDASIDLWLVQRDGNGWSAPQLVVDASVNPDDEPRAQRDEFGPLLTGDGDLWWYSFRRPFREGSTYRRTTDGTIVRVDALPDPSAPTFIAYLTLSADGNTAVMEGRAANGSGTDIYYACRSETGWSPAMVLEAVSTQDSEGTPYLTADGRQLFFASGRANPATGVAESNIYSISTDDLPIPCG